MCLFPFTKLYHTSTPKLFPLPFTSAKIFDEVILSSFHVYYYFFLFSFFSSTQMLQISNAREFKWARKLFPHTNSVASILYNAELCSVSSSHYLLCFII